MRTLQIDGLHADSALVGEHTPAQIGPLVPAGPKHRGKFPGMFHLVVQTQNDSELVTGAALYGSFSP